MNTRLAARGLAWGCALLAMTVSGFTQPSPPIPFLPAIPVIPEPDEGRDGIVAPYGPPEDYPAPRVINVKTNGSRVYCADQFLLKPLQGAEARIDQLHQRLGTRPLKIFRGLGNLQVVTVPGSLAVEQCIDTFARSGLVEYAEPDGVSRPCSSIPNDPDYNSQWSLAQIHAPQAWDVRHDATSVVVAVIDTGVNYSHPDLANNMWVNLGEIPQNTIDDDGNGYIDDIHGINALINPPPSQPDKPWDAGNPGESGGHGTQIAAIIGAEGNNSLNVAGVCWQVEIMAVKIYSGDIPDSAKIEGIDYAVENGADILNLSWGTHGLNLPLSIREVLAKARNRGVLVVAGLYNSEENNDDIEQPFYPASYEVDNIISVGASDQGDNRVWGTAYGLTTCDLFAPGQNIFTWLGVASGTSFATAHVTGVLALLKAEFPEDPYPALINRLFSSVDKPFGLETYCVTGGRLNAQVAMETTASRPANDDWSQAFSIEIPPSADPPMISVMGNNFGATYQSGEPARAGRAASRSVWWRWKAPSVGGATYHLYTDGSGFDTVLAVYQLHADGTPYWELPSPAVADDNSGPGGTSRVPFIPSPDQDYYFAVDGVGGSQGPVRLTLSKDMARVRATHLFFDEASLQRTSSSFGAYLHGPPGEEFEVEVSETLSSSFTHAFVAGGYPHTTGWRYLKSVTIPGQGRQWVVDTTANGPIRFYRARKYVGSGFSEQFSTNTIGYIELACPPGYSMVSNPLLGQSICIPDLFDGVPAGFAVSTWDEYLQQYNTHLHHGGGIWSGPDCLEDRLAPGSGAVVSNPLSTDVTVVFKGRVWEGYYESALPAVITIRSKNVPDTGYITTNLGLPVEDGDTVYLMDGGEYVSHIYYSGQWYPHEPWVEVGESFWIWRGTVGIWRNYFQMWPNGGRPL